MNIFILGASGATGKMLAEQLLALGHSIKVIVRPNSKIPDSWNNNDKVTIIKGHVHQINIKDMAKYISDCQAVASCLGHNLNWKGVYGKPRKLVRDAVRLICSAILNNKPELQVKFVLMNTAGNRNRGIDEPISFAQKIVIGLIRLLVPPHSDNEKAADYLRVSIGQQNKMIEWVAVRPDSLINEDKVTDYEVHQSPIQSALFNPGKTSRINVGNFMAQLISDQQLWNKWQGQMPVIYNKENSKT